MEVSVSRSCCRPAMLAGVDRCGRRRRAATSLAQALKDVQTPDTPLVLKAQGSFFVGGEKVEQTQVELGDLGPGGHIAVNQMYVRYMVPQGGDGNVPVVMVHGATLTGKSWETTPDGRMGWDEYFVRKGHPVYVPDQVGRGRSGFNQAVFNNVRAGSTPRGQPARLAAIQRRESSGRTSASARSPAQPFSGQPVPGGRRGRTREAGGARRQLWRRPHTQPHAQGVGGSRRPIEWRGVDGPLAIRVVSACSGAAQSRRRRKGLVLVEPGGCPATYTAEQINTLAKVPILVVFGDHRDTPTGIRRCPHGRRRFESCQALIGRIKAAGGQAEMLNPPERGIRGNSHMIMQDKNNLQIADLILQWIDERVSKRGGGRSEHHQRLIAGIGGQR